jgi:hypothetical protein
MGVSSRRVSDVSRAGETATEKVDDTEAAKEAIQQNMNGVERLAGAAIKDFHMWRAIPSANVVQFWVDKDKKAAVRQTTASIDASVISA